MMLKPTINHTRFILSFFLLAFMISLYDRAPDNDEAILAEHSYWLVEDGVPKGVMYGCMGVGWEDRLYVYHRLFVLTGAALIKTFGLSLFALRLFMLGIIGAFCLTLRSYWRDHFPAENPTGLILSLTLVFSYALFITFGYMWRPEVMVMTFGFLVYYFLQRYLSGHSLKYIVPAGLFAGMAALTHLNGVIFIGAGGLLLLLHKRWGHAVLFGTIGGLVTLLYFWDIGSMEEFEALRWQFANDPVLEKREFEWYAPAVKALNDHKRYFHKPREAAFSVLLMVALIVGAKNLWKRHRDLIIYGGSAGLALGAISHGHTSKYGLLIMPYMLLLIVHSYLGLQDKKKKGLLTGVFVLYALVQLVYTGKLISSQVNLPDRNSMIAAQIPEGSTVYGPATFFYNEVENYRLYTTQAYNLRVNRYYNLSWSKEDFFSFAKEMEAGYVVIDFKLQNDLIYKTFTEEEVTEGQSWYGYKVINRGRDYAVLKRM
ncbi:MAG: hypothetical protein WBH03_04550 [Cyclobacteriaceae bacterium]